MGIALQINIFIVLKKKIKINKNLENKFCIEKAIVVARCEQHFCMKINYRLNRTEEEEVEEIPWSFLGDRK